MLQKFAYFTTPYLNEEVPATLSPSQKHDISNMAL